MKVYCVLSDERAFRSKSPAIHNMALKRNGIVGVYVPFMVLPDRVGEAIRDVRILNIAGANVTAPYKQAVLRYLDSLSEEASAIGAVNTIVRDGNALVGHNTDAKGFMDALGSVGFDSSGKTSLVIGAGGAAKAVAYGIKTHGLGHVFIAGRNSEKARQAAEKLGLETVSFTSLAADGIEAELVVNATAVSSADESMVTAEFARRLNIGRCELVVDINYGRSENFWQELAQKHGASFVDGLPMLAYQARRSFTLWTGLEVDAREFLEALEDGS
ncbi:MAG: shikimate dehydrogenase [Deltaproteobacteria bacterium]|nr:shikimate dehydrogenase [Deltaproteobacteria bacterium]